MERQHWKVGQKLEGIEKSLVASNSKLKLEEKSKQSSRRNYTSSNKKQSNLEANLEIKQQQQSVEVASASERSEITAKANGGATASQTDPRIQSIANVLNQHSNKLKQIKSQQQQLAAAAALAAAATATTTTTTSASATNSGGAGKKLSLSTKFDNKDDNIDRLPREERAKVSKSNNKVDQSKKKQTFSSSSNKTVTGEKNKQEQGEKERIFLKSLPPQDKNNNNSSGSNPARGALGKARGERELAALKSNSTQSQVAVAAAISQTNQSSSLQQQQQQQQHQHNSISINTLLTQSNQVDQGNSYLYAYNDFVTSFGNNESNKPPPTAETRTSAKTNPQANSSSPTTTSATSSPADNPILSLPLPPHSTTSALIDHNNKQQLLQLLATQKYLLPPQAATTTTISPSNQLELQLQLQLQHQHQSQPQQENLIESDEDDAISYILHQHNYHNNININNHHQQQQQKALSSDLKLYNNNGTNLAINNQQHHCLGATTNEHLNNSNNQYNLQQLYNNIDRQNQNKENLFEEGELLEEASRIEHHLSCSRSSHPRHICGIGGSQIANDRSISNIASRLKEESRRAFVLNQRHKQTNSNNNINNKLNYFQQVESTNKTPTTSHNHNHNHHLHLCAFDNSAFTEAEVEAQAYNIQELVENKYFNSNNNQEDCLKVLQQVVKAGSGCGGGELPTSSSALELSSSSSGSNNNLDSTQNQYQYHYQQQLLPKLATSSYQQNQLISSSRLKRSAHQQQRQRAGYLSLLICSICNLIGLNSDENNNNNNNSNSNNKEEARRNRRNKKKFITEGTRTNVKAKEFEQTSRENNLITIQQSQMYTTSQQQQLAGLGQLGGQAGAYFSTNTQQDHHSHHHNHNHHHHPNHNQNHNQNNNNLQQATSNVSNVHNQHHHLHHNQNNNNNNNNHHHNHHHYPIMSSDSSLGSSGAAFATTSSAALTRVNNLFRSCFSKKCLFYSCLLLILLIFIIVISANFYLNYLINLNKINLIPLSGRLKVEQQGDQFNEMLLNKTSKEFLAKQQQYETILRGALDRTQSMFKSYPNHLLKLEVYSFKPGSLWIYFRLFLNKKSLLLDTTLMKRKSPDENLDKLFLPRLTQQTLHSGFEQLMTTFNVDLLSLPNNNNNNNNLRNSRSSLATRSAAAAGTSLNNLNNQQQRDNVKSFDDQISRLMPIIESIDLQSIQVVPEFDILQAASSNLAGSQLNAMSDNLRASQFLTTTTTTTTSSNNANIMVATASAGSNSSRLTEYEIGPNYSNSNSNQHQQSTTESNFRMPISVSTTSSTNSEQLSPSGTSDEISVSTKKFTLYGYKEGNSTRPTTSVKPATTTPRTINNNSNQQQESLFLLNNKQRKPTANSNSNNNNNNNNINMQASRSNLSATSDGAGFQTINTNKQPVQSQTLRDIQMQTHSGATRMQPSVHSSQSDDNLKLNQAPAGVVKLISGQPVVSQRNNNNNNKPNKQLEPARNINTLFAVSNNQQASADNQQQSNLDGPARRAKEQLSLNNNGNDNNGKQANETLVIQMVAPYQKIDFSSQGQESAANHQFATQSQQQQQQQQRRQQQQSSTTTTSSTTPSTSIQDLWNSALNKKNVTMKNDLVNNGNNNNQQAIDNNHLPSKRLISVSSVRQQANNNNLDTIVNGSSEQQLAGKVSVLSQEVSNTIRAQMLLNQTATTTNSPLSGAVVGSSQKPKVSPHLRHGGSIISNPVRQQQQQESTTATTSAIVLNRDFQQQSNNNNNIIIQDQDQNQNFAFNSTSTSSTTTTTTTQATPQVSTQTARFSSQQQQQQQNRSANDKQQRATLKAQNTTTSSNSGRPANVRNNHKNNSNNNKPLVKLTKKENQNGRNNNETVILTSASANNQSPAAQTIATGQPANSNGTLINSKGIRIVDDFLASLNPKNGQLVLVNQTTTRATSNSNSNNSNARIRTQALSGSSPFNFNSDNIVPTLPTTIELTRSTPSQAQAIRTIVTPSSPLFASDNNNNNDNNQGANDKLDYTTTSSSIQKSFSHPTTTESPLLPVVFERPKLLMSNGDDQTNSLSILSGQSLNRPGTSSFSNQWRPISNVIGHNINNDNNTSQAAATGNRKPNFSIILQANTEKLPNSLNALGSQSPFAMSTAILENQQQQQQQQSLRPQLMSMAPSTGFAASQSRSRNNNNNKLTNLYHQIGAGAGSNGQRASGSGGNEFESRRVSRMRQQQQQAEQNEGSSSTTTTTTAATTINEPTTASETTSFTTSGASPPTTLDSNTRLVDDFMITADRLEENMRGSTLLAPLVLSGLQKLDAVAHIRASNPVQSVPNKTRGPFAFETIKSLQTSGGEQNNNFVAPAAVAPESGSLSNRAGRSPAEFDASITNQEENPNSKLLRKKLFIENEEARLSGDDRSSELKITTTNLDKNTHNESSLVDGSALLDTNLPSRSSSSFGNRRRSKKMTSSSSGSSSNNNLETSNSFPSRSRLAAPASDGSEIGIGSDLGGDEEAPSGIDTANYYQENNNNNNNFDILINNTFRCQYYGCRAKNSQKFICLNYTQLCDDFIDCHDESDELDCVSLLQHDTKTNKLSFSNGAGIIYLNRKGSLAPMCIDYFGTGLGGSSRTAHDLEAISINNNNLIKKQQELIRQINTIGQYACSLQSFSRLVSVKINHHNLVDNMNMIKSAKLYHRLSIIGQNERQNDRGFDPSYGSYRSGTSEHEVEISSSTECPSQRTVFVKCGSFECGQDSFSVIDQNNNAIPKKGGVIINDFPWLVKLYWLGRLSCHGYLIDDLWLITSSECFVNKTTTIKTETDNSGWTAEISYEHYGNDDYQSIESNRRIIKDILTQPFGDTASSAQVLIAGQSRSPIVLAKLERPVRFSPLNRPICLPQTSSGGNSNNNNSNSNNRTGSSENFDFNSDLIQSDRSYRECVTATLPFNKNNMNNQKELNEAAPAQQLQQDLVLSKVKVHKLVGDCLKNNLLFSGEESFAKDLICVTELAKNDVGGAGGLNQQQPPDSNGSDSNDRTHVLICASNQASRSRSKWTVVGVENKVQGLKLDDPSKQLFTTVSSQLEWIVDTMNPRSYSNSFMFGIDSNSDETNNPLTAGALSQNQPCNRFRCSSGECLSFSRICDGLYDCSSQDDEKDCHK